MKAYIRILLLSIFVMASALDALAANPQKFFDDLGSEPGFDYSYISPMMLKAMGDQYLTDRAYGSLPIRTNSLKSIEMISTPTEGQNEKLWEIIKELKKNKKLETLSTKKQDFYRYDVLARINNDSQNSITHLLVITQNGGNAVDVVYMEGKIPLESLKYDIVK